MNVENLEQCPALAPLEFFALEGELRYSKSPPSSKLMRRSFLLPDTSEWLSETPFCRCRNRLE